MHDGLISTLTPAPRGVIFDYGNTLIPFGRREVEIIKHAVVAFLVGEIPGADPEVAETELRRTWTTLARERDETLRESDPRDVIRLTFRALGAEADEDDHVDRGIDCILAAFVRAVGIAEGTVPVLDSLAERGLKLGLLSNYSLTRAIHDSLERIGIRDRFDALLVSAEMGLVKPHPDLFMETARRLDLEPGEILFVGDNPAADIAGAKGVGMRAAWITEHLEGAFYFDHPEENHSDVEPDLTLRRLTDLTHGG